MPEIGSGIKSSFDLNAVGTLGLFLQGTFFGHAGIALLTNAHVIGERPASPKVWDALQKLWKPLNPGVTSPATLRKTLYEKLGTLIPAFRAGNLPSNPPRRTFVATAANPDNPIFEGDNRNLMLTDLFCEITEAEGNAGIADTIYQPRIGNDFAVGLLRTGVVYDNRARKGGTGEDRHVIAKIGDAARDKKVYKFGYTSQFRQSQVSKIASDLFYVEGTEHKNAFYKDYNGFSAKGDSGSAVFDEENSWLGLLYAGGTTGGVTGESNDQETKCYNASIILAALKRSHGDNILLAGSNGTA